MRNVKNFLWMDLEMTGLDEKRHCILEVAVVVTNPQLEVLAEYHQVVYQPETELGPERMDDFVRKMHESNGLLPLIPFGVALPQVEEQILSLIAPFFPTDGGERIVLAGNSIGNDRRFVDAYLGRLAERLHYRLLDVSSFKEVFRERYGLHFPKGNSHRALDDVHQSIQELSFYLTHVHV